MWLDGMATVRWTKPTSKPISVRNLLQVTDADSHVNVVSRFIQLPKDPGEKSLIPLAFGLRMSKRPAEKQAREAHRGGDMRQGLAGWSQAPSTVQCKDSP